MVSMHYETPRVGSEHNRPPDQCKYQLCEDDLFQIFTVYHFSIFLLYPAMSKGSEPITGSSHVTTWSGEPDTRRARDTTVTAQRAS